MHVKSWPTGVPHLHVRCQQLREVVSQSHYPAVHRRRRGAHDICSPTSRREPALSKYLLKLFVTGKTPRAELAIANLRRICEEELQGRYELEIIDVVENPQLAEDEKILATPTLIKHLPLPLRRVIGDLSDKERVLLGLNVWPDLSPPPGTPQDMT